MKWFSFGTVKPELPSRRIAQPLMSATTQLKWISGAHCIAEAPDNV